jgi:hypothetical protein
MPRSITADSPTAAAIAELTALLAATNSLTFVLALEAVTVMSSMLAFALSCAVSFSISD